MFFDGPDVPTGLNVKNEGLYFVKCKSPRKDIK